MQEIIDWFGDVFYVEKTVTTYSEGFVSERYTYSNAQQIIQLPYEDTTTVTETVLDYSAVAAFVIVVLVFVTVVTTVRSSILK